MKTKSTKKALLLSALSMLMCVAMLVGTTFAWFTDSVTSGKNTIMAGNLDVELEYLTEDGWKTVEGATDLFTNELWEPGHTDVVYLKLSNKGTLALKYEFGINIESETPGINVAGDEFKLSDYIYYDVIEEKNGEADAFADRAAAIAAADEAVIISSEYNKSGSMNAKDEVYLAIVAYMPTSVGNEANYKTGASRVPTIDLGLKLNAYQMNFEKDSFGDDYDKGLGTSFVSDYNEFVEALENGGKIVLTNDIDATAQVQVPAGVTAVLDLNGHKITSAYQDGSTTKHIYPVNNYGDLTITDSGKGGVVGRGIYNQDGAKITVNGAKIVAEDVNGGACIWSYGTGEVYLNDAELIGYTGVVSSEGYVEINGGTYTCYSGIAEDGTEFTAPTYNIRAYNGLKITDGNFTSRHGVISVGGGEAVIEGGSYTINFASATTSNVLYVYGNTEMTVNGGNFISNDSANKADSGAAVLVSGSTAKLDIYGGNFVGMNGMVSGNANTSLYGGTYNTVWDYNHYDKLETYLADGYIANQNTNGSWTVVSETYTIPVADGLFSDGEKDYAVTSGNGFKALNALMGTAGGETTNAKNIELLADIDMAGKSWDTIGWNQSYGFESIKGNGFTISNMVINGNAMFSNLSGTDVTISDLTFDNVKAETTSINTAIIVGQTYTNLTLDNVDVKNSYIKGGYKVAPLVATVYNEGASTVVLTVKNCDVSDTIVEATSYDFCTTGLVAFVNAGDNDKVEFENSTVSNVKLVVPYDGYQAHAFVYTTGSGSLYDEADGVTVTNCSVETYLDGTTTFAGGTLTLKDGTYVTSEEGENALTVTGDTTLVVEGEATLGGGKNGSGIYVADGVTLNIIGDGNLTVYGNSQMEYEESGNYCEFNVPAFAGAGGSGIGGNGTIVIDGLAGLTAEGYGKNGFGIGGNGADVTVRNTTIEYVRGGFVNVTGEYIDAKYNKNEPEGGAAIGGAKITLENTTVKEAVGGSKAAGIGARFWQPADITITNCTIDKVVGGASSAGIGGSRVDNSDIYQNVTITITDSIITAIGGYYGAGIGTGYDTHCQTPDKAPMTYIYIKGNSVINATGGKYAAGIGTGYHVANLDGEIESTVTVTAASGEKFYKDTYTQAQDIGFGVTDPAREGLNNTSSIKYNGVEITIPAVG